jgi:branched-chain amino acid transport system substrate-binding protein
LSLAGDRSAVVKANGGTVVGTVRHPINTSDFSSFLMKAANEFGINKTTKIAGLLVFINDVHSLRLANTEGLQMADSWY